MVLGRKKAQRWLENKECFLKKIGMEFKLQKKMSHMIYGSGHEGAGVLLPVFFSIKW